MNGEGQGSPDRAQHPQNTFQELPDRDTNPGPPAWHADSVITRPFSRQHAFV